MPEEHKMENQGENKAYESNNLSTRKGREAPKDVARTSPSTDKAHSKVQEEPKVPNKKGNALNGSSEKSVIAPAARSNHEVHLRNILVLGPQGSGKSSLINAACNAPSRETSIGFELLTKEFHHTYLHAGTYKFALIDSPGFDNTSISDQDIFVKLVQYLCSGKTIVKLSGIIYIHPEGIGLGSSILKKNLHALRNLFGDSHLDRFTILFVPRSNTIDRERLVSFLKNPPSPFSDICKLGARVEVSTLETQAIRQVLLRYSAKTPVLMKVHDDYSREAKIDVGRYIRKCLQAKGSWADANTKHTSNQDSTKPKPVQDGSAETKQSTERILELDSKVGELSTELERSRAEYTSLRSQLQIHENVEQSEVTQTLMDLNRQVEDLARSLSQHLVDTYAQPNMTTREAFQLREIQKLFEHPETKASLVLSSTGVGRPLEDFFDLAMRSLISEQLYKRIFLPFHPNVPAADQKNTYTTKLYSQVRERESQPAAGRWRTSTFDAISRVVGNQMSQLKTQIARDILNENLMPLLKLFFGPDKDAEPIARHIESLEEIVSQAWEWNLLLKGKIILLGDFQPTGYRCGVPFDPDTMSEFEARHGSQDPDRILATINLGLSVFRAQGAGKAPERTVLLKATVVTDRWFEEV